MTAPRSRASVRTAPESVGICDQRGRNQMLPDLSAAGKCRLGPRTCRNGREGRTEEERASYPLLGAHPRVSLASQRGVSSLLLLHLFLHSPRTYQGTAQPRMGPRWALRVTQVCGVPWGGWAARRGTGPPGQHREAGAICRPLGPQALPWGLLCREPELQSQLRSSG